MLICDKKIIETERQMTNHIAAETMGFMTDSTCCLRGGNWYLRASLILCRLGSGNSTNETKISKKENWRQDLEKEFNDTLLNIEIKYILKSIVYHFYCPQREGTYATNH